MKTTKWMKAGMLALLCGTLTVGSANAYTEKNGSIGGTCSGSCMDTWKVQCKNGQTHRVRSIVRDSASAFVNIIVTTLGYKGPSSLIGQADPEVGNVGFSSGSDIQRQGSTHGATDALVLVSVEDSPYSSNYEVRFYCLDANGGQVGDPIATLLQNDHQ